MPMTRCENCKFWYGLDDSEGVCWRWPPFGDLITANYIQCGSGERHIEGEERWPAGKTEIDLRVLPIARYVK